MSGYGWLGKQLAWVMVCMLVFAGMGRAQVATTNIVDTIYRADGTPAGGSLLLSWPEFTTSANQAVPAGKTEIQIASNGGVSIPLAPNAGAMPAGTYYTAVYHLSDGTVSTEYWTVPVATQTTIAAVRTSVLPATVAVQSASESYVNGAITSALTGYLPLGGGTLTGPVYLSGDPVQNSEAANKHYVDANIGSVSGGIGTKLDMNPTGAQTINQPSGTTMSLNSLQNVLYAGQSQSGGGNNGISNVMALSGCQNGACMVIADPGYSTLEEPQGFPFPSPNTSSGACGTLPGSGDNALCGFLWPVNSKLWDQRGGTDIFAYQNPVSRFGGLGLGHPLNYPGANSSDVATAVTDIFSYDTDYGNGQLISHENLQYQFAGGHNGNYGSGWGKTNTIVGVAKATNYSQGQHAIGLGINYCLGLGDCMGSPTHIVYSVGLSSPSDEGIHEGDSWIAEDARVYQGTCAAGNCPAFTTGAKETVTTTPLPAGYGEQGEGRMAIDLNKASAGSCSQCLLTGTAPNQMGVGNQIQSSAAVSNGMIEYTAASGTFAESTGIGTISSAIVALAGDGQPGVTTVAISTTGGTANTFIPGVVCIADSGSFEMAYASLASSTSLTASFRKPHLSGAFIAQGGTCGWGMALNGDLIPASGGTVTTFTSAIRVLFPLFGSPDSSHSYGNGYVLANSGSSWSFAQQTSGVAACYGSGCSPASPGLVTVTGNFGFEYNAGGSTFGNIYGQSLTISGSSDANYNGTFAVTVTGPSSFTYTPVSAPTSATISSLTVTECNCSFTLYPRAEVLSVYNSSTKQVDGTLSLEPNTIPFSTGDTIEEPHWHMPLVNDTHNFINMFQTQAGSYGRGYSYGGIVTGSLYGFDLRNSAPMAEYQGYGGWRQPPGVAYHITGWWNTSLFINNAPNTTLIGVGCKPDMAGTGSGCTSWNSAYNLFSLGAASGGSATIGFNPATYNYSFAASNSPCVTAIGASVGTVAGVAEGGMSVLASYTQAPCALFTSGLVIGGDSAATALTGVQGTGAQIVTNTAPTITSASLAGTSVVPAGATLTIAGSVNITGSCTGCSGVTVPGSSGQFLTSNGSSGFGAPLSSTGSGSIMLSGSPTTTGTLTAAAINASGAVTAASLSAGAITGSGTLGQSGTVNINTGANSGNAVNINTGAGSGSVYLGSSGNIVSVGGGMFVNGVTSNGDTVYSAQGTSTSSAGPYNSYYWTEQANYWNSSTSSLCAAYLSPYTSISSTRFSLNWNASGRSICSGYSGVIISDFSAFLDGMKVTRILPAQSTSPANVIAPPTAAVGDGAGSGSVTVSTSPLSTDMGGVLTVVVSGSPSANAAIVTLTFNDPYISTPICWAVPGSANAIGTFFVPPSSMSANGFAIYSGSTALAAGTYVYTYGCN